MNDSRYSVRQKMELFHRHGHQYDSVPTRQEPHVSSNAVGSKRASEGVRVKGKRGKQVERRGESNVKQQPLS